MFEKLSTWFRVGLKITLEDMRDSKQLKRSGQISSRLGWMAKAAPINWAWND